MLVLSRRPDESVLIGANVEVFVVSVRGDRVRLGFRVPKSITVHRKEIAREIVAGGAVLAELIPAACSAENSH